MPQKGRFIEQTLRIQHFSVAQALRSFFESRQLRR
jgi:hypothetical protein